MFHTWKSSHWCMWCLYALLTSSSHDKEECGEWHDGSPISPCFACASQLPGNYMLIWGMAFALTIGFFVLSHYQIIIHSDCSNLSFQQEYRRAVIAFIPPNTWQYWLFYFRHSGVCVSPLTTLFLLFKNCLDYSRIFYFHYGISLSISIINLLGFIELALYWVIKIFSIFCVVGWIVFPKRYAEG